MKPETATLATLFQQADVGWVFDQATFNENPDEVAVRVRTHMRQVHAVLTKEFPSRRIPPLEDAIQNNPERLKPLVQAFATPVTPPMCAMVYAVLDGAEVASIQFSYQAKRLVRLEVIVEYETGEAATFSSNEVWDVEVLRHFGIMKLGTKPVIDGYYAFRRSAE